jgi:hypothetical protein
MLLAHLHLFRSSAANAAVSAVCGRKWKRRALGVSAPAEQLQYVWHAAHYIAMCSKFAATAPESTEDAASRSTALDAELAALRGFKATILEKLPEEQVGAVWCTETCRLMQAQKVRVHMLACVVVLQGDVAASGPPFWRSCLKSRWVQCYGLLHTDSQLSVREIRIHGG